MSRRLGWIYLAPALLFTLAFFIAPLAIMAVHSIALRVGGRTVQAWSLANYTRFLERDYLTSALLNSLEVTALTVIVTTPLAYGFALALVYAVPRRWQGAAVALAALPFFTSYVVRTYAWLLVLSDQGVVNAALLGSGLLDAPLRLVASRAGVLIVFVHYFIMVMTLTLWVSLRHIPDSLIRAALDLGASPLQAFVRVILPLSLPGLMVGMFLTAVFTIGDYVTPQILGGNQELLMPQAIMLQVGRTGDTPMAAALALVLMAVVVLIAAGCARWLRLERA